MVLDDKDYQQVLKAVFEKMSESLKVNVVGGEINISATDDSIRLGDGTNLTTTTVVGSDVGLDVNVLNEVTPSGLKNNLRVSVLSIGETPVKIPTTALQDRNTMAVRVWGSNIVYFGGPDVTPETGYPKQQFEELSVDIKDNTEVNLWGICDAGLTSEVRVIEVS